LTFYEHWLSPTGLRGGQKGLAPLGAVLSFLHREGPPDDHAIPARAGACAAEWTYAARPAFRKGVIRRLPLGMRARSALNMGRTLVNDSISPSKVTSRFRRGHAVVAIQSPVFEYLREPSLAPLRCFYRAAFLAYLHLCEVDAVVDVDGTAAGCRLLITVHGARPPHPTLLDVT
jgi:hypothetical protein